MPVGVASARCGHDLAAGEVDVVDRDDAVQADVVLHEPSGTAQVESGVAAAQIRLAQVRLGVGQCGVAAEYADGDLGVLAHKGLRSGKPCWTTADGDEPWCHHFLWVPPARLCYSTVSDMVTKRSDVVGRNAPAQAERVACGASEHPEPVLAVSIGHAGRPEGEDVTLGGVDVVDLDVEVELLRALRVGESGWFVF